MDDKKIIINGSTVAYLEANSHNKNILLFIHGNSLSKEVFEQQLSSELFSSYRLIALDLLGHGKTDQSKNASEEYNVPFLAKLIANFIETLHLEKVVLVGHSLGGHIAIELAGVLPKSIVGMTINGCPPLGIPADVSTAFLPNPVGGLLFQSELNDSQIDEMATAIVKTEHKKHVLTTIKKSDPLLRSSIGASIMTANYTDEIEILKSISIPYAIFLGEKDTFCNAEYFKKYNFSNQWRHELQVIPSGTHTPYLDNAEVMNNLLLEFLTENSL